MLMACSTKGCIVSLCLDVANLVSLVQKQPGQGVIRQQKSKERISQVIASGTPIIVAQVSLSNSVVMCMKVSMYIPNFQRNLEPLERQRENHSWTGLHWQFQ